MRCAPPRPSPRVFSGWPIAPGTARPGAAPTWWRSIPPTCACWRPGWQGARAAVRASMDDYRRTSACDHRGYVAARDLINRRGFRGTADGVRRSRQELMGIPEFARVVQIQTFSVPACAETCGARLTVPPTCVDAQ